LTAGRNTVQLPKSIDTSMFLDKVKQFSVIDERDGEIQQSIDEQNDEEQFDITQIEPMKMDDGQNEVKGAMIEE